MEIGNLTALQELDLRNNHLEGELPATISSLQSLSYLALGTNRLIGALPPDFGRLQPLAVIGLANNNFSGTLPPAFCSFSSLQILDLSDNNLFGELPNCWWDLKSLQYMGLSRNRFSGNLPDTRNHTSLKSLHLANNLFSGGFPSALKKFGRLVTLDLGENKYYGTIPSWLGVRNPMLQFLRLRSNMFRGNISCQLAQLFKLQLLDLANNKIIGSIPRGFANLTSMMEPKTEIFMILPENSTNYPYFDRISANWKGQDNVFQRTVTLLTGIDLSCNFLSGGIPKGLPNLQGLLLLNLSRNHLSGGIPTDIGNLKFVESLDFSWNQLSGSIPSSFSNLMSLRGLNLSHNLLSGKIPTGHQLQTFEDPSIYDHNAGLCGFPLSIACSDDPSPVPAFDKQDTQWLPYWEIGGFIFGFWLCIGVLFFSERCRTMIFYHVDRMQIMVMQKIAA
uniref:non-specific serine/threonine protein kinase n=1 Tax=Oryza brachyantha TaxID=4533 RepID=J3LQS9_ORYBR